MEDTIFTSPTGDGTAILRGHPRHAKVLFLFQHKENLYQDRLTKTTVTTQHIMNLYWFKFPQQVCKAFQDSKYFNSVRE